MSKISKTSYKYSLLFKALFIIYPLYTVYIWLSGATIPFGYNAIRMLQEGIDFSSFPLTLRVYACLLYMIPTALVMAQFYYLAQLFQLYAKGMIFAKQNINYLKKIGFMLIWQAIAVILVQPLITMVLTINAAPGEHIFAVALSNDEVSSMAIGGIVILISWVMNEGRKLQEESALTV
jgi:hypothetical protein